MVVNRAGYMRGRACVTVCLLSASNGIVSGLLRSSLSFTAKFEIWQTPDFNPDFTEATVPAGATVPTEATVLNLVL